MIRFYNIADVYRYLDGLPSFQVQGASAARFGLDRIREFCQHMGHPERTIPYIHIAGTNGKGSVAAMLALAWEKAGYNCGLYTSPHLNHFRERFHVNGGMITEADLLRFFQLFGDEIQSAQLSYFEISTAIAFWWFAEQKTDIAVLETGLGGRLDATNVVIPEVSVITTVAHDHMDILGKTLSRIASEKGGIIKSGKPVVIGNMPKTARQVIVEIAGKHQAPVIDARQMKPKYRYSPDYSNAGNEVRLQEKGQTLSFKTDLQVPVHRWNVAVSRLVIRTMEDRFPVSETAFAESLRNIGRSRLLAGRFEKLHPDLNWYFDGAHNPDAVRTLVETIKGQDWPHPPVIVLSVMKDKAQKKMLQPFSVFKKNYYYTLNTERAADIALITPCLSNINSLPPNEEEIIDFFKGFTKKVVIFTGSFYFYSVVRRWISRIIKAE